MHGLGWGVDFRGEDAIIVEKRRSKEYSEAILADVKSCLSGFTKYKYLVVENILLVKHINLQPTA